VPPLSRRAVARILGGLALLAVCVAVAGLALRDRPHPRYVIAGASAARGRAALTAYGCGSCHRIPGVRPAVGVVGPPLEHWAQRTYVGGRLANTPGNLVRWIMRPQGVVPGNAMPDLGVSEPAARDMAAYLYGLR
jgi:cytochrome c1